VLLFAHGSELRLDLRVHGVALRWRDWHASHAQPPTARSAEVRRRRVPDHVQQPTSH
jgi:hypothetical protein